MWKGRTLGMRKLVVVDKTHYQGLETNVSPLYVVNSKGLAPGSKSYKIVWGSTSSFEEESSDTRHYDRAP